MGLGFSRSIRSLFHRFRVRSSDIQDLRVSGCRVQFVKFQEGSPYETTL